MTKHNELNIEEMPSAFKSHIPTWHLFVLVVTGRITGITATKKNKGQKCFYLAWESGRSYLFCTCWHLYVCTRSVPLLDISKQFLSRIAKSGSA